MTILEATRQASDALRSGDLERLQRSLQARREAIAAGEAPTVEAWASGEELLAGLRQLQRQAAYDSARLGQIRRYVELRAADPGQ